MSMSISGLVVGCNGFLSANRFDIFSGCSPNHVGTSNKEKSLPTSERQNLSPPYVGVVDMENFWPERTADALISLTVSRVLDRRMRDVAIQSQHKARLSMAVAAHRVDRYKLYVQVLPEFLQPSSLEWDKPPEG